MTELIVKPMLADKIDKSRLPKIADDPNTAWEQKVDGDRQLIHVNNGRVFVANREGKAKANGSLPGPVMAYFGAMKGGPYIFDGEIVGRVFWLFDLPVASTYVTCSDPFRYRRDVLAEWYALWGESPHVRLLPSIRDTLGKLELARDLYANGAEGVIIRDLDAPYVSGKRTKNILKAKYVEDVDCFVTELQRGTNEAGKPKSNIVVAVYDANGAEREIGEVTANAGDGERIQIGDVVKVKYLYMTADHRLYQPTYPKLRTDKPKHECTMDQGIRYGNKEVMA